MHFDCSPDEPSFIPAAIYPNNQTYYEKTILTIGLSAGLLLPSLATAQVTLDGNAPLLSPGDVAAETFSYTASAGNNLLVIALGGRENSDFGSLYSAVSFGSQSLTHLTTVGMNGSATSTQGMEIWYLNNPTTGSSQTIDWEIEPDASAQSGGNSDLAIYSFGNADSISVLDTAHDAESTSTTGTASADGSFILGFNYSNTGFSYPDDASGAGTYTDLTDRDGNTVSLTSGYNSNVTSGTELTYNWGPSNQSGSAMFEVTAIPEPDTMGMLVGLAAIGMTLTRRRRMKS